MQHLRLIPVLLLACPLLFACLENEEEIEILPDGSVRVQIAARGDAADLTQGWAVPLHGPWLPVGDDTQLWLAHVGPDTGSPAARERMRRAVWPGAMDEEVRLVSQGIFDSVDHWPSRSVPASDPYASAYLKRTASLRIEERGGRTVYVFERTYHARRQAGYQPMQAALEDLPDELRARLEAEQPPSAEEWELIALSFRRAFGNTAERFASEALLGIYTAGEADLSPHVVPALRRAAREAVERVVTAEALRGIHEGSEASDVDGRNPGEAFEHDLREALRSSLVGELERQRVSETSRNGVLYAIEWAMTDHDHTSDLGDEKFVVRLRLPGVLVGGNHDSEQDGSAVWEFEGGDLYDRDQVLRAVSVLD